MNRRADIKPNMRLFGLSGGILPRNRRADSESAVYALLIVILAAGILLLIVTVTGKMFHLNLSFG